jgi:hypothetical protein
MANQLKLFSVTLNWSPSGDNEGDYATYVWAKNEDEAIRMAAEEMADSDEKCFDDSEDREEYVDSLVRNASIYAAIEVSLRVNAEIETLMKGSTGTWNPEAKADFETLKSIFARYGQPGSVSKNLDDATQVVLPAWVLKEILAIATPAWNKMCDELGKGGYAASEQRPAETMAMETASKVLNGIEVVTPKLS